MKIKNVIIISILLLSIALISSGCGEIAREDNNENMIDVSEFLANNPKPQEIIEYLNENIGVIIPKDGDTLVLALEDAQEKMLPNLEEEFFQFPQIKDDDEETTNDILIRTEKNGFKVDQAEGMNFPIIDYSVYQAWTAIVSEDIESYINIMTRESNNPPAKDAAFMIEWDKIVDRALKQEKYVTKFPNSARFDRVEALFNNYKQFIFFGIDNTPLFDFYNNAVNKNALTAYLKAVNDSSSPLAQSIKEFVELVRENDNLATEEVNKFRENFKKGS